MCLSTLAVADVLILSRTALLSNPPDWSHSDNLGSDLSDLSQAPSIDILLRCLLLPTSLPLCQPRLRSCCPLR